MANFVYSFDTGLYDTSNHSEDGYPWKSGPTPVKGGKLGYDISTFNDYPPTGSATGTGEYFANARFAYDGHSSTVVSPLSTMNGSVQYLSGGDLGTHANNKGATGSVIGALFNYIPTASAASDFYIVFRLPTFGTSGPSHTADWHFPIMRFSSHYAKETIALVTNTNETVLYTIPDGHKHNNYDIINPIGWTTAALSGKDLAVGPNLRRKVALGYV